MKIVYTICIHADAAPTPKKHSRKQEMPIGIFSCQEGRLFVQYTAVSVNFIPMGSMYGIVTYVSKYTVRPMDPFFGPYETTNFGGISR